MREHEGDEFHLFGPVIMGKNNHAVTSNGWRIGITNSGGTVYPEKSKGRKGTVTAL